VKIKPEKLEQNILDFGSEIFQEVIDTAPGIFEPQFYVDKMLQWAMQLPELRTRLFHFVDVLPALNSSAAIMRHVQEYFKPVSQQIPPFLRFGLNIRPNALAANLAAELIRKQVSNVAEQFIIAPNATEALPKLQKLRKNKMAFTVDLLGEATLSEKESIEYQQEYINLLKTLHSAVPGWAERKAIIAGHSGEKSVINISVKLSALYSQAKAISFEHSVGVLSERLVEIMTFAKKIGAFVYVDMEDCALTSVVIETFKRSLSTPALKDFDQAGLVMQAYLRRTEDDIDELTAWAKNRGVPIGVRLVKGAYWDTETILAKQHGWPIPVWQHKSASDFNYERLSTKLLKQQLFIIPAFASHNIRSLCHAIKAADAMEIPPTRYELQFLYGMAEPIKMAFSRRGYLVRQYVPVGDLIPGMGYLVRRLLENTSNEGFLRQSFYGSETPQTLLAAPQLFANDTGIEHLQHDKKREFRNSAFTDFTVEQNRLALSQALANVKAELSANPENIYPIINGNELQNSARTIPSISPEDPQFVLGHIYLADNNMADDAAQKLYNYFPRWRESAVSERIEILFRAAEIMEMRRAELTALVTWEAGKPWIEADADVAEAIDFLNYYALEAEKLFTSKQMGAYPGEVNSYFYEPRGVCLVISPWNFTLAIPCGMFAAAVVTGNCAILKPAEQSSIVAARFFEIMLDAGLPEEAAAFLPGYGEEVGAYLAAHPLVNTTVFTGSKAVGMELVKTGAQSSENCEDVKKVIVEMGGKNAIIVDDDADLDEAVKGVVYSAFGYQGQKCSACSRVLVVGDCYEKFIERLKEATNSITVGPASDPATIVGPVIDEEAFNRLNSAIDKASRSTTLLTRGKSAPKDKTLGYYVSPSVFTDIEPGHWLLTTELFGPVLAVMRCSDFDDALDKALQSEYALTGAVFSRSPANIEKAKRAFRVGNLYINRGSTGALVMRQPFGGAKKSGVGSKAGGPDYLLQFVTPRSISENTIRRGFA